MFRFTIRELVLVTVIAGMGAAWYVDHLHLKPIASQAEVWKFKAEALAERMKHIGWTVDFGENSVYAADKNGEAWPNRDQ